MSAPGSASTQPTENRFKAVSELLAVIHEDHVIGRTPGESAFKGVLALREMDARLDIRRQGDLWHLTYEGRDVAQARPPSTNDNLRWSLTLLSFADAAYNASPHLRQMGSQRFFERILEAVTSDLDPHSGFSGRSKEGAVV